MKQKLPFLFILFLVSYCSFSQGVGIGTITPDVSAVLDITATNKGLLIPRMSLASINAIINPARGLLAYDSTANQLMANIGTPATPNWQPITGNNNGGWDLTGNSGINPVNQFIGTTDNQALRFRINNLPAGELHPVNGNISWGVGAGQGNTTGFSNIAIGADALRSNTISGKLVAIGDSALFNNNGGSLNIAIGSKSLFSNTTGANNTAVGIESLRSNILGNGNTATGFNSLFFNTSGSFNTATGFGSLGLNTTGSNNTGVGSESLFSNTTGVDNTATGFRSLIFNSTGFENTGVGSGSLFSNTTGNGNTAVGSSALSANTTSVFNTAIGSRALRSSVGFSNTGVGYQALRDNTIGHDNTAFGVDALNVNTTGNFNVAVGNFSLFLNGNAEQNTAVGHNAGSNFQLGSNNTLIGANADIAFDDLFNCVALGRNTRCFASNQVRFGNMSTTSIGGFVGYSNLSDGRFKRNIKEDVKGIDFIMKLRPVTYQLDITGINNKLYTGTKANELAKNAVNENEKTTFSGFIAQEVEQAAKQTGYNFSGIDKPKNENDMYGLRYSDFVVPMVKAMQEQQQMINELKKINADLLKRIEKLESSFNVKK